MKKKITLFVVVILTLGLAGIVALHIKDGMDKPSPLVACADQQATSPFVVRKGCEPSEKTNVTQVTKLLEELPAELHAGRTDSLTVEARQLDFKKALPAGSTVLVYPDTWRRTGAVGSMTVKIKQFGLLPKSKKFTVVVFNEGGIWKVSQAY